MQTVLIVIHLLIVIALVGVVLIQRSEGGGLGIGGGSGFMTARGTKNALTRLTAILALCFFATSIALVVLDSVSNPAADIINRIPAKETQVPTQNTPSTATEQIPTGEGQAPANNANQPAGSNSQVMKTRRATKARQRRMLKNLPQMAINQLRLRKIRFRSNRKIRYQTTKRGIGILF